MKDPKASLQEKLLAQEAMQKLGRDTSLCRVRSRCFITGRSRGVYSRFGLGRHKLREFAGEGIIPGLAKASW